MTHLKPIYLFTLTFSCLGCDHIFEYSPYEIRVNNEDKYQNEKSLTNLKQKDHDTIAAFSFAVISDTHDEFATLQKGVDKINELDSIDFAVHLGDITNKGLLKQFEFFSDIVSHLKIPLLPCIGNHDYLSNGEAIYEEMFGSTNYSMNYKNIQFIFFDDTHWESNHEPNFVWLEKTVTENDFPKIICTHIPPDSDQFTKENTERYKNILLSNNVILNLHGHCHTPDSGMSLNTEIPFIIVGSIDKGVICKITINPDFSYKLERIPF